MANVLHRISKVYLRSVNTPEYSADDWIINPNLSAVKGYPEKYWAIDGNDVFLMDKTERATVDAEELAAAKAAVIAAEIARLDSDPMLKALITFQAMKSGESAAIIKATLIAAIEAQ